MWVCERKCINYVLLLIAPAIKRKLSTKSAATLSRGDWIFFFLFPTGFDWRKEINVACKLPGEYFGRSWMGEKSVRACLCVQVEAMNSKQHIFVYQCDKFGNASERYRITVNYVWFGFEACILCLPTKSIYCSFGPHTYVCMLTQSFHSFYSLHPHIDRHISRWQLLLVFIDISLFLIQCVAW